MTAPRRCTRFLASVRSEREALLAAAGGADIIDCKEPSDGALGALPVAVIAAVRNFVPRHIPVSATIGDVPSDAELVCGRVAALAATGIEYVKIGVFPGGDPYRVAAALGQLDLKRVRLVAVLLADRAPDFDLIDAFAAAGFAGVMLDTAGKDGRSLLDHQSPSALGAFVSRVQAAGCFAGLAGSLRSRDIPTLLAHHPDVLGFRGALCRNGSRAMALDATAIAAVREAIAGGVQRQRVREIAS
jgi:uncharacterized protein (UPF0264 family)